MRPYSAVLCAVGIVLTAGRDVRMSPQDDCGDTLISMGLGGMEEMGVFYEHCLETLYPPGQCGVFCNMHSYQCRLAEVQEACCAGAGDCGPNGLLVRAWPKRFYLLRCS